MKKYIIIIFMLMPLTLFCSNHFRDFFYNYTPVFYKTINISKNGVSVIDTVIKPVYDLRDTLKNASRLAIAYDDDLSSIMKDKPYTTLRIISNSFLHDKIYSPSLFTIVLSDSISCLFYKSRKDAYQYMPLNTYPKAIVKAFINTSSGVLCNNVVDTNCSMYCIIEQIDNCKMQKNYIIYNYSDYIKLNVNILLKNKELDTIISNYNAFLKLLKDLVTELRCNFHKYKNIIP